MSGCGNNQPAFKKDGARWIDIVAPAIYRMGRKKRVKKKMKKK